MARFYTVLTVKLKIWSFSMQRHCNLLTSSSLNSNFVGSRCTSYFLFTSCIKGPLILYRDWHPMIEADPVTSGHHNGLEVRPCQSVNPLMVPVGRTRDVSLSPYKPNNWPHVQCWLFSDVKTWSSPSGNAWPISPHHNQKPIRSNSKISRKTNFAFIKNSLDGNERVENNDHTGIRGSMLWIIPGGDTRL